MEKEIFLVSTIYTDGDGEHHNMALKCFSTRELARSFANFRHIESIKNSLNVWEYGLTNKELTKKQRDNYEKKILNLKEQIVSYTISGDFPMEDYLISTISFVTE